MKFFDYLYNFILTKAYADGEASMSVITNPLKTQSIQELIAQVLKLFYQVGLPLVVVMFIYAGFLYVTAGGDTGKVKRAHEALKYTVVGAVVVLGASVIAAIIKGTIDSLAK